VRNASLKLKSSFENYDIDLRKNIFEKKYICSPEKNTAFVDRK